MHSSRKFSRFHLLVILFVASMFLLILRPNLVTLILGWDGLGISSFFLVIFYKSNKAYNAGLLTALTNRVGDALILVSLSLILPFRSFTFPIRILGGIRPATLTLGTFIVAAITKSAQVPFSAWLPAAMAAPTPVSALVHSSTLVTAGVYLLFRVLPAVKRAERLVTIGALGAVTTFMARLSAFLESDLKKIVALSTLRQLGVIILRMALHLPILAFFHLIVHAFFKALLFIATGNVIHNSNDYQDLRRRGGNRLALPFNQSIIVLTKIRLCGVPFFSAFFSKEFILESLGRAAYTNFIIFLRMWAGVAFTILYSLRFIYYVLQSSRRTALFWKEDRTISLALSKLILLAPRVLTGKFILPGLIDFLETPITSFRAKGGVLSLIFMGGPLIFLIRSFTPTTNNLKSVFYIFFLRRWRGAGPIGRISYFSSSSFWRNRFGWKDFIFLSWALSGAKALFIILPSPGRTYFKRIALRAVLLIIWVL